MWQARSRDTRSPTTPLMKGNRNFEAASGSLNLRLLEGDGKSTHRCSQVSTLGPQEGSLWEEIKTEDNSLWMPSGGGWSSGRLQAQWSA